MQFGSENYQLKDSYFVVAHPFTYVVLGILGLVAMTVIIITLMKRKNKKRI